MHLACCSFGRQQIATHDAIQDIMYALVCKSGHAVWREWWYALTSRVSLQVDFYMTRENQVFIVDVVVTDPTWEMVASSVINQLVSVAMKLNAITKIRKYREGFMRGTTLFQWPWRCMTHLGVIWIVSLGSVPIFSTIDNRKVIYPHFFSFNFLNNVLVLLFNVL
jgi:hypothetical protein